MLKNRLKQIVGDKGWSADAADRENYLTDRRSRRRGAALAVVSPASTAEVAAIVRECAAQGISIVPQGGNTGLCGGSLSAADQVLLSLSRLNRVRAVDSQDFSIIVEAGCVLADVQRAAAEAGRYFPLSLGAEGSCQIGGNLSTNAGGINVLRYGTARQQVLGLEVVLADGSVWHGLRTVRKDTAGYDLKQVFIGSEGTLGIITAAALRLWPWPANITTVLLAINSPGDAVALLARLRDAIGDTVQAFELMSDCCLDLVRKHVPDAAAPLGETHPWFVLTEVAVGRDNAALEQAMMAAIEAGLIRDAVVAKSESESDRLWRLRHSISEAQRPEGIALKHDISVPTSHIAEFLDRADGLVEERLPGARIVAFGHVGDGNIHYDVLPPAGADAAAFERDGEQATLALYDLADELGGSFSAEHGVGLFKKDYLARYRGGVEIDLMRALKSALDPRNTLNPGKVI